jgi:hypothetical protein
MLLLFSKYSIVVMNFFHDIPDTADMPVDRTSKLQVDSMSDALSFAVESSD